MSSKGLLLQNLCTDKRSNPWKTTGNTQKLHIDTTNSAKKLCRQNIQKSNKKQNYNKVKQMFKNVKLNNPSAALQPTIR